MALSDKELERMVNNLRTAFEDVSGHFEYVRKNKSAYAGAHEDYRELAESLSRISMAYLKAAEVQQIREESGDSKKVESLPKPLKRPESR